MAAHTYDNAVALIALTADGRPDAARRLAEALVGVLETNGDQGFFYDSYNVVDRAVGQGTASGTGPNAWAAFALAIYGRTYDDPAALDAAAKVTRWIRDTLYDASTGGVLGGICHPFEERPEDHHALDTTFPFTSTEQVIDTWHLFRIMGDTEQAEAVASWLTTEGRGWIETDPGLGDGCRQDRRFSTGTNIQCGQDSRLFLDPQSWGSIVANMVGAPGKARGAIEAAQEHLSVTSTVGGETLTGFGDSCLPKDQMIWYGGSAQMIVAYVYDGNVRAATQLLNEMSRVQNPDGSWNHSSGNSHAWQGTGCGTYESFHSDRPHIGETAWNYFALRDVNEDLRLPYSLPSIQTRALPLVLNRSALP